MNGLPVQMDLVVAALDRGLRSPGSAGAARLCSGLSSQRDGHYGGHIWGRLKGRYRSPGTISQGRYICGRGGSGGEGGWAEKGLSVDLSQGRLEEMDTLEYAQDYIGGRGRKSSAWVDGRDGSTTSIGGEGSRTMCVGRFVIGLMNRKGGDVFG